MTNWYDAGSRPFAPSGFVHIPDAVEAIGTIIFPDTWTGNECEERALVDPFPKPALVYARNSKAIADYKLHDQFAPAVRKQLGLTSYVSDLSKDQWADAFDSRAREELNSGDRLDRKRTVFDTMQRLASGGALKFARVDPIDADVLVMGNGAWNCSAECAHARLQLCSVSNEERFAMAPPPANPDERAAYFGSFYYQLFVEERSLIESLKRIYVQPYGSPDEMPDASRVKVEDLLRAVTKNPGNQDKQNAAAITGEMVPPSPIKAKRGRKSIYDWIAAQGAVMELDGREDTLALIIRGELPQAAAEKYMADWFCLRDQEPSQSLIREHVSALVQHRRESNAAKAGN